VNAMTTTAVVDRSDYVSAAARFLYEEAIILDDRRFGEWLELFAVDARYQMYAQEFVGAGNAAGRPPEPVKQLLTDETREFLTIRVARLERALAGCEIPASVTRHLITNVYVEDVVGPAINVRSNFLVFQYRTDTHTLMGSRRDVLVPDPDGQLRISRREVVLDHGVTPRTLTVFL